MEIKHKALITLGAPTYKVHYQFLRKKGFKMNLLVRNIHYSYLVIMGVCTNQIRFA